MRRVILSAEENVTQDPAAAIPGTEADRTVSTPGFHFGEEMFMPDFPRIHLLFSRKSRMRLQRHYEPIRGKVSFSLDELFLTWYC